MVANDERLKVLKMIQEGKLTPDEGVELLDVLDEQTADDPPAKASAMPKTGSRFMRLRVTDMNTGKVRANIRLPLGVVKAGIKMGARFSPELHGIDIDQFEEFINSGEIGHMLDVEDVKDGEHVEIYIE